MARPSGTVTFLFTDIEGSTRLWDEHTDTMRVALARHDEILRTVIAAHDGTVFSTGGDGVGAAFGRASDAVLAAVEAQRQLGTEAWPAPVRLRVRMGIHTGEAQERDGDYFGPPLNRAARVMALGHGGQIIVSSTSAGIVSGVELQDLGEYRLRDLPGVERLFQVRAEGLRAEFPRLRTADGTPGNLPVQTTRFVGREREMSELSELVRVHRLVTLIGVGGVGKTRLALEVAAQLSIESSDRAGPGTTGIGTIALTEPAARGPEDRYRDGAWLCELADIASSDAIVEALATTLQVRQHRGKVLLASIASAFRDARALVVVDNCEHVLISARDVLAVLLRECPGVTVIATSREPLDVIGEIDFPVEPLLVPERDDEAVESAAFTLFVERALERGVHVEVDPSTRAAVLEICRRLDGLPLAIELAAARARTMSVIELSRRLDERFRLLARTRTAGPSRQRTLWDVVDWSYQLLESSDQQLFCHLAVFLGGFTIEAAAAVSGRPPAEVEAAVWALTERSLVQLTPSATGSRYQMLETLRHFGLEQLNKTANEARARAAHVRHFVEFARESGSGVRGADEAFHVKRITSDLANLRAAHQHAVSTNRAVEAANLVAALHDYAEWRQFFELGTWAQATLELGHGTTGLTPTLHAIVGWARCIAGDFDAASDHARQGLEAETTDGVQCGWLYDVLAHCAYFQGDANTGLIHSGHEIDRARASGEPYRLSYVLADSGTHAANEGNVKLGHERADEALRLARQIDNPALVSMAHLARGFATRAADPVRSIEWFRRACDLADTVDSTWTSGIGRIELSLLLALHGDPHEAVELGLAQLLAFRRADDTARVRGGIRMVIPALYRLVRPAQWVDLVVLDAGTADRPHVREPFNDQAVADVVAHIVTDIGRETFDQAASQGATMADQDLLDLALSIMHSTASRPT